MLVNSVVLYLDSWLNITLPRVYAGCFCSSAFCPYIVESLCDDTNIRKIRRHVQLANYVSTYRLLSSGKLSFPYLSSTVSFNHNIIFSLKFSKWFVSSNLSFLSHLLAANFNEILPSKIFFYLL